MTLHLHTRNAAVLVAVPALALLMAGCGGYGSTSSGGSSSTSGSYNYRHGAAATGAATGRTVMVKEKEYRIMLPTRLSPGTYTFKIADTGRYTHQLEIDGPGVSDRKSSAVTPGATTSLTVTLRKGTYQVYCPIDGHRGLGMNTKVTVG